MKSDRSGENVTERKGIWEKFDLTGRTAIVTGASRGIGRGIARALAEAGADIALVSRTPGANQESAAADVRETGRRAEIITADLSRPNDCERIVQEAAAAFGRLDILVNNAGVAIPGRIEDTTVEVWDQLIGTNLTGYLYSAIAASKVMREQRSGTIVNIVSVAGMVSYPGLGAYGVTKAGTIQMTKVLANEWARWNIRVNAVAPPYVETDMNTDWRANPDKALENAYNRAAFRRFARIDELLGAVLYLASDASAFATGTILNVDGGLLCR